MTAGEVLRGDDVDRGADGTGRERGSRRREDKRIERLNGRLSVNGRKRPGEEGGARQEESTREMGR